MKLSALFTKCVPFFIMVMMEKDENSDATNSKVLRLSMLKFQNGKQ